jgi:hypothetical protein
MDFSGSLAVATQSPVQDARRESASGKAVNVTVVVPASAAEPAQQVPPSRPQLIALTLLWYAGLSELAVTRPLPVPVTLTSSPGWN